MHELLPVAYAQNNLPHPLVAGAPGPRREPATFLTERKGPNHYPSWEVVAERL
jgi:hypothetical protein